MTNNSENRAGLNPALFEVADIYETSVDPLARVMRTECRKRGIPRLKVVYSKEKPLAPITPLADGLRRSVPGSVSFVPGAMGLILAGEVVKDLVFQAQERRQARILH